MPKYSRKQRIKFAEKICQLYESGGETIESCCRTAGIDYDTFISWAAPFLPEGREPNALQLKRGFIREVHERYLKAKGLNEELYYERLRKAVHTGLEKKANGFTFEEVTTEIRMDKEGNAKPGLVKKTVKYYPPSDTILIFTGKNLDPKKFSDTQRVEHSGEIKTGFNMMTLDEIRLKKAEMQKLLEDDSRAEGDSSAESPTA